MSCISNERVYGLAESIFRSGYPMRSLAPLSDEFNEEIRKINEDIYGAKEQNKHIKRAITLASSSSPGDDQFLTGIIVQFDLTLPQKAWVEAERYKFLNFVSSMSTMHRAARLPFSNLCNQYVAGEILDKIEELQNEYNSIDAALEPEHKKEAYLELLYNIPSGFELTAGMTTNYRCLKNIYRQRRNHRLPDWHIVCDWIETLPMAKEFICNA